MRHAKRDFLASFNVSSYFLLAAVGVPIFYDVRIGRSCQPVCSCRLFTKCTGKMFADAGWVRIA